MPGTYRIYRRTHPNGADTLVDTVSAATLSCIVSAPGWYHVRAVSTCGVEDNEPVAPKLRHVAFDGAGELLALAPNQPLDLKLTPTAGGGVTASWGYSKARQRFAPATFNVYIATGATAFDLNTPDFQIAYTTQRLRWEQALGTFAHGVRVRVRVEAQASAADGEGRSEGVTGEVYADAVAPNAPSSIEVEVAGE